MEKFGKMLEDLLETEIMSFSSEQLFLDFQRYL